MFAWVGISEAPISELSGDDTGLIAIAWLSGPILAEDPIAHKKPKVHATKRSTQASPTAVPKFSQFGNNVTQYKSAIEHFVKKVQVEYCGSFAYNYVYTSVLGTDLRKINSFQFASVVAAFMIAAAYQVITWETMSAVSPEDAAEVEVDSALSSDFVTSALLVARGPSLRDEEANSNTFENQQSRLEAAFDALVEQQVRTAALVEQEARTEALVEQQARTEDPIQDRSLGPTPRKEDFSNLAYYVFSETPPDEKPADTVLKTMKNLPMGTPVEEIKRASDAFGLDFSFMKAVAKIESGFNPKQRTGSYIGLFQ